MNRIGKIPTRDLDDFITLIVNAYPAFEVSTKEQKKKLKEYFIQLEKGDPTISNYGLYRAGKLLGGMKFYDYTMQLFDTRIPVGGVGMIAVDLVHKKEKICKEMVSYFIRHYDQKGYYMTALYPFRPDFYRKMGFGYGTKQNEYKIKPADLPRGKSKEHIRFLGKKDEKAMVDCYNRLAGQTHGMFFRSKYELAKFRRKGVRTIGYKKGDKIQGYVAFSFKSAKLTHPLLNDIQIIEMIYENREVFSELMTFLHTQDDEINRIIYDTQDEYFHFAPFDPRDDSQTFFAPVYQQSNIQGVGIMYRVINTSGIFKALASHNFGGQNCRLKLTVADSFFPKNEGSYLIHFNNGKPSLKRSCGSDVEIKLDVSDFSSMLMGCINFKSLYNYGLAEITDAAFIDTVNGLFLTSDKPKCLTSF